MKRQAQKSPLIKKWIQDREFTHNVQKRGRSALSIAIDDGHKTIIDFWLEQGGSLDWKDSRGNTILFSAVTNPNNIVKAKSLIESGAEVNVENASGQTPLFSAVEKVDNARMIALLLEHGAEINHADHNGATPLFWYVSSVFSNYQSDKAKEKSCPNAWFLLEHEANPSIQGDEEENSILHLAVQYELIDVTRWLIKNGAEVNMKNRRGNSPLHNHIDPFGSGGDSMEILKLLVENGADLELYTGWGWSTLHSAVMENWIEAVAYLLENGAKVNVHDTSGIHGTPLHAATSSDGSVEMVDLLIANGADVNAQDKSSGNTPLHDAVMRSSVDMVKSLLAAEVRVDIQNKYKQTALDFAHQRKKEEIISLFDE